MTATAERRKKPASPRRSVPATEPPLVIVTQITEIELTRLRNHPANPEPSPAEVAETAEWLRSRGQEEPLVVRPVAGEPDVCEILAGKRRFLAAKQLRWQSLQCRVRHDMADDKSAIEFMAASNAQRHAETPIRQALMLQALLDAGATEAEAGAVYGWKGDSSVRVKLLLLKLPTVWQERIVSGETTEKAARSLAPYVAYPELMEAIDTAYRVDQQSDFDAEQWHRPDDFAQCVKDVVLSHVRPVEKGGFHQYGHELGYSHECYIRRNPAIDEELGVVPLPLGPKGKSIFVATNPDRYDELQIPLIKARLAKQQSKRTGGVASDEASSSGTRKRTPGEQKVLDKEQDEQLATRIRRWRHEWLRFLIADKLRQKVPDHWVLTKIVLWCLSQQWNWSAHNQLKVEQCVIELAGGKGDLADVLNHTTATPQTLLEVICRSLLMPEKNPDYPVWPFDFVDQVAIDLGVDLADAWLIMQSNGGADASLESFYTLHNSRQLRALASEFDVYLGQNVSKSAALKVLGAVERIVKLPKSIEPLEKLEKKRRAK